MEPSTFQKVRVGCWMLGCGPWASVRGLPLRQGLCAGAEVAAAIVTAALQERTGWLTLYPEPGAGRSGDFGRLCLERLCADTERLVALGVRLRVIGRREGLAGPLRSTIEAAERQTALGHRLQLQLAVDYDPHETLARAARLHALDSRAGFGGAVARAQRDDPAAPAIDLLIGTAGRTPDRELLPWEAAYAKLVALEVRWPDFEPRHLRAALRLLDASEPSRPALRPSRPLARLHDAVLRESIRG